MREHFPTKNKLQHHVQVGIILKTQNIILENNVITLLLLVDGDDDCLIK